MKPSTIARTLLVLIVGLIVLTLVTGCGLNRHINKVESKSDSTAKKSVTVREKIDTIIKLPESRVTGSKPIENLQEGDTLRIENAYQRVWVTIQDGNIYATGESKPVDIPVSMERETIHTEETIIKTENTATEKKTEAGTAPFPTFLAVILCLFIIGLLVLRYLLRKVS